MSDDLPTLFRQFAAEAAEAVSVIWKAPDEIYFGTVRSGKVKRLHILLDRFADNCKRILTDTLSETVKQENKTQTEGLSADKQATLVRGVVNSAIAKIDRMLHKVSTGGPRDADSILGGTPETLAAELVQQASSEITAELARLSRS